MSPANKKGTKKKKKRNDRKLTLFGLLSRDGNACGGVFIARLSFIQFHGLFKSHYEVGATASGC